MASAVHYPYLAHLEIPFFGTCSATLIAFDRIVTAAHRVVGADESVLEHAEVSVRWDSGTQYRQVAEVWVHPRHTDQDAVALTDWGIALARLARPVEDPAAPIRLPQSAAASSV